MLARKTVTVLFCDVADSTPLGERLDPESLQRVMSRWFDQARTVIEHHGGTVEKFIGDEVMAVFGVPVVHEDDALRAVRAAAEMRRLLARLNADFERDYGVRIAVRMGINTGEVVAGDPTTGGSFVTGEPVILAKRLEQAAGPGEILIGKATYPLVRDAVRAGPLESFPVKGKSDPVAPWRIDRVDADAAGVSRRLDAPLVGRLEELARLRAEYDAAVHERSCRLVTMIGAAGIGKSRLAQELATIVGPEGRVLSGRCLPYGEGITFWPLVDVVKGLGGDGELATALAGEEDGALVADRVRAAIGTAEAAPGDEVFWAVRRLVETVATDRPLLLVLEDIHWAEPTFLDLVEYLHGWTESVSVLVLCLARPELLERRAGWTVPRERATTVTLEPLSEDHAVQLLADLAADLPEAERERVLSSAEGNPLYVEQMAALAESGEVVVPPTIQALLAERLDRLEAEQRAIVERAAVVGREFTRRQVTDLCAPELRPHVGRHLLALVRNDLIRPHSARSSREDTFRFRHGLIRDAAYDGMPKEARALFHEWFADWIERNAGESVAEREEIMGYHLEQAFRLREQLGPADDRARRIGRRGAERLAASGRRAFARDDPPAALNLLERARRLLAPNAPELGALLATIASAQMKTGDFRGAEGTLTEGAEAARRAGDRRSELRIAVERQAHRWFTAPVQTSDENLRVAREVIPELEALGDDLGLTKAWRLLSDGHATACRWQQRVEALERALEHARRTPEARPEISGIVGQLAQALHYGPTPVPEAIARCRELLESEAQDRAARAGVASSLAPLFAAEGAFDEARTLYADGMALYDELGLHFRRTVRALDGAEIELLGGELGEAERILREAYETLERMGETGVRAVVAAFLADVLCRRSADEEAAEFADVAEELAEADDIAAQVVRRSVQARVLARAGRLDEAEGPATEAVELADRTDFLTLRADARIGLAEVRGDRALLDEARALYERKGNVSAIRALAAAL